MPSAQFIVAMILGCVIVPQLANVATTVYLHRALTHRAITLKKPATWFFRIIIWLTTGIIPKTWAAVHRKHHRFTDQVGDPHSPIVLGFWKVQLFNVWYYARESKHIDTNRWAKDVPEYGWLDRHSLPGCLIGFSVLYLICGWWGVAAGGIHMVIYIGLNSLVNGLCHVRGYKTYPEADAYNVRWVAFFASGEGLHNNHHKYPANPKLRTGHKWFEFDLGWLCIKFLQFIGQVEYKKPSA